MFVSAYVPLAAAVARGTGERLGQAGADDVERPRSSRVNREASQRCACAARGRAWCSTFGHRLRIGRLHGARRVELIAVDACGFDLGLRVEQRVRWRMAQEVALTDGCCCGAPSVDLGVQLELLGRGPEALKTWTGEVSSENSGGPRPKRAHPTPGEVGHRDL